MRENDIVFLNLHRRYTNSSPRYGGFLGIYLLAAFVNSNGYAGQAFAGTLHNGRKIVDELCKQNKVKIIGLYCDYANVTENVYLSAYIKEKYKLPVLIGGPQATSLTKDFLVKSKADAIIRYEGELTVLELLDFYLDNTGALTDIAGISYLADGKVMINKERPLIENLDALPFVDEDCYLLPRHDWRELSIMTGRGCPFHCSFCHEGGHTQKVRFRSVENVLAEIDAYMEAHPYQKNIHILFTDDAFTLNVERVKRICDGLKERRKKIPFFWFCEGHVHTLKMHPEMIDYIADAGAQRIQLGIEAGTDKVLQAYHKNTTTEEIKEVVALCRDAGIQQVYGNIILGSAFFSKDRYEKDLQFAKDLLTIGKGCLELGVVTYWPLPETELTNHPDRYDLQILDYDFYTSADDFPQTATDGLDCWDILKLHRRMEHEIQKHMIDMLKNNEVPLERLLSWYPSDIAFKSYGLWWQALQHLPELFAYGEMLSLEEGIRSTDISTDEWDMAIPLRVLPINKYMEIDDKGEKYYAGQKLSEQECHVLRLSAGRRTIQEIYHELEFDGILSTADDLKSILNHLERMHFIVYAQE